MKVIFCGVFYPIHLPLPSLFTISFYYDDDDDDDESIVVVFVVVLLVVERCIKKVF